MRKKCYCCSDTLGISQWTCLVIIKYIQVLFQSRVTIVKLLRNLLHYLLFYTVFVFWIMCNTKRWTNLPFNHHYYHQLDPGQQQGGLSAFDRKYFHRQIILR